MTYTIEYHWSKSVWIVTVGVIFGLAAVVAWLFYNCLTCMSVFNIALLIIVLVAAVVGIGIVEGYAPQRIEVSEESITILRRYKSIVIPTSTIISITDLEPKKVLFAVRTFGSGGIFGYYGDFRCKFLGKFKMYATEFDHLLLIKTSNQNIVISCIEPDLLKK